MYSACLEIIWLVGLLKELGIKASTRIPFHEDNTNAIRIAVNLVPYEHSRHIEVDLSLYSGKA